MKTRLIRLGVLISVLLWNVLLLKSQEAGYSFITNYGVKAYEGHPQNFSVAQDTSGIIYIGNAISGIIRYDGKTWQPIPSEKQTIRRLKAGRDGRVYVGMTGDFGYLQKNDQQQIEYHSLLPHADSAFSKVNNVWSVHIGDDRVFFQSEQTLFIWDGKQLAYISLNGAYYESFLLENQLYLDNKKDGLLYKLDNEQLVPLTDNEDPILKRVEQVFRHDEHHLLIVTRYEGLFLFNEQSKTYSVYECPVNVLLQEDRINEAITLQDGSIALGSAFKGVIIINKKGELLKRIDQSKGLKDLTVWDITQDRQGNLWLATNNGISKIEITTGLEFWDKNSGLQGVPLVLQRYEDKLHAATTVGAYYLEGGVFKKIEGLDAACFAMKKVELDGEPPMLIIGTDRGLYQWQNKQLKLLDKTSVYLLHHFQQSPGHLFLTDLSGYFNIYKYSDGYWQPSAQKKVISDQGNWFSSVTEDTNGHLWIGTEETGVFKINDPLSVEEDFIEHFFEDKGLKSQMAYSVSIKEGALFLYSQNGFYRWDNEKQRFHVDSVFAQKIGFEDPLPNIYPFQANRRGDLWMYSNKTPNNRIVGAVKQKEGYLLDTIALRRIQSAAVSALLPENDGTVWVASSDVLYRYQPDAFSAAEASFSAVINKVVTNEDSVLFNGVIIAGLQDTGTAPVLQFKNNFIRFTFGATAYCFEERTQFSYRLKGYHEKWSDWSNDDYKEFTNLSEGSYTFELRAQNVYGQVSQVCQYEFSIIPPWYRTLWAYLGYIVLIVLGVYLIFRWYSHRLKAENERLERIIEYRTQEVQQQHQSLEERNEQLHSTIQQLKETQTQLIQSEKMASLGQLTAGIAHELNNPINFVSANAQALTFDFRDLLPLIKKVQKLPEKEKEASKILEELIALKKQVGLEDTIEEMNLLIEGIARGAKRTQDIVKSLRVFSHNTSEEFSPANINEAIESTLIILNSQLDDKIMLVKELGDIPLVDCQIGKLNQVFLNIIVNAIQALEQGEKFTATATNPYDK